jgi:hypothetical protein
VRFVGAEAAARNRRHTVRRMEAGRVHDKRVAIPRRDGVAVWSTDRRCPPTRVCDSVM